METSTLILKSIKNKNLKNMKNKNLVGKFFMDHPKGYMGYLKYPDLKKIKKYQFSKLKQK